MKSRYDYRSNHNSNFQTLPMSLTGRHTKQPLSLQVAISNRLDFVHHVTPNNQKILTPSAHERIK
jgi:hypothetical protein